jgi:hypothetical protein
MREVSAKKPVELEWTKWNGHCTVATFSSSGFTPVASVAKRAVGTADCPYVATVTVNGQPKYTGNFGTVEEGKRVADLVVAGAALLELRRRKGA